MLVLDEAVEGLDVHSRRVFLEALRQATERGVCTVAISHNIEDLMLLCDQVAWVHVAEEAGQPNRIETITAAAFAQRILAGRQASSTSRRRDLRGRIAMSLRIVIVSLALVVQASLPAFCDPATRAAAPATQPTDADALLDQIASAPIGARPLQERPRPGKYLGAAQTIWPALLAGAALAFAGGIAGVFMVLRREALVALSMPQVIMLGAALGLRFGGALGLSHEWETLPPALLIVAVALALVAWYRGRREGDLILPALYIGGVCLSILVIYRRRPTWKRCNGSSPALT